MSVEFCVCGHPRNIHKDDKVCNASVGIDFGPCGCTEFSLKTENKFKLGRTYSEHNDGTPYLESPSGRVVWLHPDSNSKKNHEFLDELNRLLKA